MATDWKKNHPQIPRDWRQMGEGGNAFVWRHNDQAIKRLKPNVGDEARIRFRRECLLMKELSSRTDIKIVPVKDVREREGGDEIVMQALDGHLDNVIERFRGRPSKAAAALKDVVETLSLLVALERPINHRDLKPSNLLYRGNEDNLYIGDFGCAYLAGDERVTPDHRALGAWAFRPPEYSSGPVAHVDEKGDVFSLGKILWSMVNGVPKITFPGPVWFLPEYDLTYIFPNTLKAAEVMYIVARCCSIRAEKRVSLRELSSMLDALISDVLPLNLEIDASALKREELLEVEYDQRRAKAQLFLTAIIGDFQRSLDQLSEANPGSNWTTSLVDAWQRVNDPIGSMIEQVAVRESDALLMQLRKLQHQFIARFQPEDYSGPLRLEVSFGKERSPTPIPRLIVEAAERGVVARIMRGSAETEIASYTSATIPEFIRRAIDAI